VQILSLKIKQHVIKANKTLGNVQKR